MPTRKVLLAAMIAGLAGCGTKPAPAPPVAMVVPEPAPAPAPVPPPAAAPAPPPEPFRFADDRGGKQVERVLAPAAPPVPELPTAGGPRPRAADLDRGELPLPAPRAAPVPHPPVPRRDPLPTPPAERVPADLGPVAAVRPGPGALPEVPVSVFRAWDVPVPTPATDLPPARPVSDKTPTTDPTAALSATRIMSALLPVRALAAPVLQLVLPGTPDLARQIRPRPVPEFGTMPVTVPPGRP